MCIFVMVVRFLSTRKIKTIPPPPHYSHSHRSPSFLMPKARGTTLNPRSCVAPVCFPLLFFSFPLSRFFLHPSPHSPQANLSVVIHVGRDFSPPQPPHPPSRLPRAFQAASALPLSASVLSNEGNSAICVRCQDGGDGA